MADESGKKTGVRTRLYRLTIAVLLLVGAGGLLYPLVSAAWNAYREQRLISSYSETVKKLDDRRNREIWEDALAYNRQHRVNAPADAFGKEKEADLPHPYADLLNPNGDGVIGYIEIPKIALSIPIGHGTGPDVLERGCGHLEGTSLPTGGTGNHTVLSAHRGLPGAKLFTDLDQIREGDRFYLHILDKVLAYQTDQILTVLPDETEALAIDPEEDYATLVTCTPYAVNTHRLLVRGHRIPYEVKQEKTDRRQNRNPFERLGMTERIFLAGVAALALIALVMFVIYRMTVRRGRKRNGGQRGKRL